jgi:hypothetical protein
MRPWSDKENSMIDPTIRTAFLDIAANEYAIPKDIEPVAFALQSIPLLGVAEGEFRERHVYGTLHRWIVSDQLPDEGLRRIHMALLAEDALFSGIGERETDSVFFRAFAVLTLVPTLYAHRQRGFLTPGDLEYTSECLARYLGEERDLRGYVSSDKWWAHGIAHAADAVGQLVRCPELPVRTLHDLLESVATAMTPESTVYMHEEDARMAAAVIHLLKRDTLPVDAIERWLKRVVPEARFEGLLPDVHICYVNARNFLRCLIFQARGSAVATSLVNAIEAAHKSLPDR